MDSRYAVPLLPTGSPRTLPSAWRAAARLVL